MRALAIPPDWPFRSASRHIACRPHLWHVQDLGAGPLLLLIHGAGGASHSFRHLIPLLAASHRVIAVDLPGQGFSVLGAKSRCSLNHMADDLKALCQQEGWQPQAIIGHSAGAALALRLAQIMPLRAVVGLNAALGNFEGAAGLFYPILARLLAMTPLIAQLFSKIAGTPQQARQLLLATGSRIEPAGEAQYLRLLRMPSHVAATLAMMAQWQLDGLLASLPQLGLPVLLISSSGDRAVPASVSATAAKALPDAQWINLPGFGHLLHEEAADKFAPLILDVLARTAPAA